MPPPRCHLNTSAAVETVCGSKVHCCTHPSRLAAHMCTSAAHCSLWYGVLQVTKKLTTQVMSAIKALAVVYQASQLGSVLPPEAFYNELIRCAASSGPWITP